MSSAQGLKMNDSIQITLKQAEAAMDVLTLEKRKERFELDRNQRIKKLKQLPNQWRNWAFAIAASVFCIGLLFSFRPFPLLILVSSITFASVSIIWRVRISKLLQSEMNQKF
jgi:hypothetical protein